MKSAAAPTTCRTQEVRAEPLVSSPCFLFDQDRLLLPADGDSDSIRQQHSGAVQKKHVQLGVSFNPIFATLCGAWIALLGAMDIADCDEIERHSVKLKQCLA